MLLWARVRIGTNLLPVGLYLGLMAVGCFYFALADAEAVASFLQELLPCAHKARGPNRSASSLRPVRS